jgi:hypothetical protein
MADILRIGMTAHLKRNSRPGHWRALLAPRKSIALPLIFKNEEYFVTDSGFFRPSVHDSKTTFIGVSYLNSSPIRRSVLG